MTLSEDEIWARLAAATHGVLATVHPARGVDAVPVVYAVAGRTVLIPIDTVKSKRTTRLQRITNLEGDGRCALLVDHYEDAWDMLWWVRVHAVGAVADPTDATIAALAARYPRYAAPGSVVSSLVLTPTAVTGWSAA